jgi:hypothetical protein
MPVGRTDALPLDRPSGDPMMPTGPAHRAAACLLSGLLAGAAPATASAQADEPWRWEGALYLWIPAVGGQTSFPTDGSSVDVSAEQVIDALQSLLMGSLGVKKGRWGVWTDLAHADFGAAKQASRDFTVGGRPLPAGVDGRLELELQATAWTLAGSYTLAEAPTHSIDLLAGARRLDLRETLTWSIGGDLAGTGLTGREGTSRAELENWDALIGLRGRAYLEPGRRWFVPFHFDVGAGDSDRTWQASAGIGYRFDWGSLVASYRYLDYEMASGQPIQSLNFSGGLVGVAFQW